MTTIQMTIDDDLLRQLDQIIKETNTTRSAFIRESITHYLKMVRIKELEKKHREGYLKKPVIEDEISVWEQEQIWGE